MVSTLLLLSIQIIISSSQSMEWCEYWTLLDQKDNHPECSLFSNSKETILRRLGRYPEESYHNPTINPYEPVAAPPRCETDNEVIDCLECESSCSNHNPVCNRDICSRGCVCAGGFVRGIDGECIPIENCPIIPSEKEAKIYIDNVKRYMPVLVNDLWKYLFGVEQPSSQIVNTPKLLSAIFSDQFSKKKH